MIVRNVRVNNYLNEAYKLHIDKLSKIYIICGWLFGAYSMPVVFKMKRFYKVLTFIYSLLFCVGVIYYVQYANRVHITDFGILNLVQYLVCIAITTMSWKTVRNFYKELFEFDGEVGYQFLISSDSKRNFVQAFATFIFIILFNIVFRALCVSHIKPEMLPMDVNHILNVYFCGHLLSLLNNRLKSIRILLLLFFPTKNQISLYAENASINYDDKNAIYLKNKHSKVEMRKLMFLYVKIINAYDFLNAAVKWQLLVILAISFVMTLDTAYILSLSIIKNKFTWQEVYFGIGLCTIKVAPLVVPFKFAEKVHNELLLLRTALHARTYNNVLDKTSRSIASSFLALTEVRSLSFSVFRMIEVNMLLPFKFLGLAASYVVILLQFQKVLNV